MELFMDSYLENAMDYVQETFESANEWMKENDPLKFPEVEAKESKLSLENIESKPILDEKLSVIGEVGEDQSSLSITEKINKGIDYIGSAVENANEWIKRNDPFKLPIVGVGAYGIDDIEVRHRIPDVPPAIPAPLHNYDWGSPPPILVPIPTYSTNPINSHMSTSQPFNPSNGQIITNPDTDTQKYCKNEPYLVREKVCSSQVYGNVKAERVCRTETVEKFNYVCYGR
jgi:hypothetical protein